MAGRRTNLGLLALLAIAAVTGIAAYLIGTPHVRWVLVAHGMAAVAIVVLSPWKTMIARRGLRRSRRGRAASLFLVVLVLVTIGSGVLFSTGTVLRYGPFTAMQIHVGAAVTAIAVAITHIALRWQPLRTADFGRRSFLRVGALAGLAAAGYAGLETFSKAAGLAGAQRRFTGSHERGSFDPAAMPTTSWINDSAPAIDAATYRLTIDDLGERKRYEVAELAPATSIIATLDCTGGWFATQRWGGVPLDRLLSGSGQSIRVISTTGYERRFPIEAASDLLLATEVGGAPLSRGHGAPVRLVAPGRRGFWWVKWIEAVVVDDRPPWWQPPFPLT